MQNSQKECRPEDDVFLLQKVSKRCCCRSGRQRLGNVSCESKEGNLVAHIFP